MVSHRLTPPQESYIGATAGAQEDDDLDLLRKWFLGRGINIEEVLNNHNRVQQAIEEDAIFLNRAKNVIDNLPASEINEALDRFLKEFKEEAEQAQAASAAILESGSPFCNGRSIACCFYDR